jgi:hypothetical protein
MLFSGQFGHFRKKLCPPGHLRQKSWYNSLESAFAASLDRRCFSSPDQPSTDQRREVRKMGAEQIIIAVLRAAAGVIEEVIRKK